MVQLVHLERGRLCVESANLRVFFPPGFPLPIYVCVLQVYARTIAGAAAAVRKGKNVNPVSQELFYAILYDTVFAVFCHFFPFR